MFRFLTCLLTKLVKDLQPALSSEASTDSCELACSVYKHDERAAS